MSSNNGHACGAVLALVLVVSMCAGSTPSATDGGGAGGARVRAQEAGADSAESVGGTQAWRRGLRREERGGDEQGSSSMREEIEIGIEKRKDEIWDEHEVPQMSRKVERAENCTHDSRTGCLPNGDMSMQSASSLPILICTALSRFVTGREGGHPTSRFAGCVQQRRRPPPPSPGGCRSLEARLRPTSIYGFLPPYHYLLRSLLTASWFLFGALQWGEKVHAASNIGDISWTARGRLCVQARNTG
ncbi:hypothetical protein B0H14DRAFT_2588412 [Mycena olivaceomarginata]|nr:hypothetical protein B0H14DRAFT_2588412 [Mycena olivaceomarginata]